MLDIISVGDATIDYICMIEDATINCSINKKTCQMCLNYGDKLPVKDLHRVVAGNAANMAVGSARLGLRTGAYIELGKDDAGQLIFDTLRKEKVSTRYMSLDANAATNTSFVLSFQGDRTILVYHTAQRYRPPALEAKWLYVTSMGKNFRDAYDPIVKQLDRNRHMNLAFNPGTYQFKAGTKVLKPMLERTTVLFVNKEEAIRLIGGNHKTWPTLLRRVWELGPKKVVITDGREGAHCFDGERMWHLGQFPGEPIERTGAGDAFGTGTVAGLVHGIELHEAMRWGAANASSVVRKPGPQAGLLTIKQMLDSLKKHKRIVSKPVAMAVKRAK